MTPSPVGQRWGGLHWVRLAPDDPLSLVTRVRRWSGGYIAIGREAGGGSTPVWSSRDGATWRPIASDTATTFWPGMTILDAAPVPGGVVAIGRMGSDCGGTCPITYSGSVVSWTSRDGLAWSPHAIPEGWLAGSTPPSSAAVLAAGHAGLVVSLAGSARLASSTDGIHWLRVAGDPFSGRLSIVDLAGTSSSYVAVGQVGPVGSGVSAASWSADGRQWTTPAALPAPRDARRASTPEGILVAGDGAMAVGRILATPGATLWWRSPDGRGWTPLPTYAPLGASECVGEGCGLGPAGGLAGDGSRIVAVRFGSSAGAWTTTDATSWSPLEMFGDVPDPDARPIALLPSGVLAATGAAAWLGIAVPR